MACLHVLIFAVIGRNTIPEIFQVFMVFPVTVITIAVHCLQDLKIKVLTEQEEFQKFVYKHVKANHHLYNYIHPNGWDYFKVITLSLCCLWVIYLLSYISLNGN